MISFRLGLSDHLHLQLLTNVGTISFFLFASPFYNFFAKFFRSASKPGENSCGASGILGISTPLGNPSITSRVPPSSNGESPLNIL